MAGRIVLYGATGYVGGYRAGDGRQRREAGRGTPDRRDPYSFTAPMLAWAAGRAATQGVRPAGALGPVEASGLSGLERACAEAGLSRERRS